MSQQQQQPYDSSIKAILNEDAPAILPLLLPGVEVLEILDVEILRSPMRADRVYRVLYRGKPHIFHLEFQANRDDKMAFRMAVYHTQLLEKYELPIISMVVYLFKTTIVTSPLQEFSGTEELLRFNFRVLPLWDMDGRPYIEQHKISMYTLLPMMENINDTMLLQAIDELIEYCKGDASKLERRLLWLSTFLRRAEVMPPLEKQRVQERLKMFDELLEQDEFVQKQRERGLQQGRIEGRIEGKVEGQIEAYQIILVDIVKNKFPSLEDLAQRRAAQTRKVDALREVINLVSAVNDENTARFILNPSAA